MAALAFKESCELHTCFVRSLTVKDLITFEGLTIGNMYLKIASSMWRRGFVEAGNYAGHFSLQYDVSKFLIYREMYASYLHNIVIKHLRLIFAPHTRLFLRGIWYRFISGQSKK